MAAAAPVTNDALKQLARDVLQRASAAKLRISTAESCTGGLIAAYLTEIEGCSHMVDGAVICYSDAAKVKLLGLSPDLIASEGAVSAAVAKAMVAHIREKSGSDLLLSITGYAGDAGPDDEAGLVHFAVMTADGPVTHVARHYGDIGREATRARCLEDAFRMMLKEMEDA
ncbi:CinA family protein [Pseudonocardia sp. TMWB2A]|uniref:CinA family protein n=1 Tax=Pseudonocardia sp. TMWB2A TaxID=687430 RepID=UPI00307D93EA